MAERDDDYMRPVKILLLEAGRIMEDVGPDFAMASPDIEAVRTRIDRLDHVTSDLHALAAAVRVLLRHLQPTDHSANLLE